MCHAAKVTEVVHVRLAAEPSLERRLADNAPCERTVQHVDRREHRLTPEVVWYPFGLLRVRCALLLPGETRLAQLLHLLDGRKALHQLTVRHLLELLEVQMAEACVPTP